MRLFSNFRISPKDTNSDYRQLTMERIADQIDVLINLFDKRVSWKSVKIDLLKIQQQIKTHRLTFAPYLAHPLLTVTSPQSRFRVPLNRVLSQDQ